MDMGLIRCHCKCHKPGLPQMNGAAARNFLWISLNRHPFGSFPAENMTKAGQERCLPFDEGQKGWNEKRTRVRGLRGEMSRG